MAEDYSRLHYQRTPAHREMGGPQSPNIGCALRNSGRQNLQMEILRTTHDEAEARSLRSDRAFVPLDRYVATEFEPKLGRYVVTEPNPRFGRYIATELRSRSLRSDRAQAKARSLRSYRATVPLDR